MNSTARLTPEAQLTPTDNTYNILYEYGVICSLIATPNTYYKLPTNFKADVFIDGRNTLIFQAIADLHHKDRAVDAVTVVEHLNRTKKLSAAGGEKHIERIVVESPASFYNFETYAERLIEMSARRKALAALDEARGLLLANPDMPVGDVIGGVVMDALQSLDGDGSREPPELKETIAEFIETVENPVQQRCYETGFYSLNRVLTGLYPGDLIIIAARPSLGKTTLAMNIADAVMAHSNEQVIFFSMEMSRKKIIGRYVSSLAKIPLQTVRTGQYTDEQKGNAYLAAANILQHRKLVIDDRERRTPQDLLMFCRKQARKGQIAAIVVDYLQLMSCPQYKNDRFQEVSEISRSLKALAVQMDCPVIALAQLNRSAVNRKPRASDLRESGQIEQDADVILMLHRENDPDNDSDSSYRGRNKEPKPILPEGVTELIVAKQRDGEVGSIKMLLQGAYSRFVEYTADAAMGIDE